MPRPSLVAACLVLAAQTVHALECPDAHRAMRGSHAGLAHLQEVPMPAWDACIAEWCERDAAYGMVVREGPIRILLDGATVAAGRVSNGERRWRWTVFDRNTGRAKFHGAWRLGRRSGHWADWWDNGVKRYDGHYRAGLTHGSWRHWDEAGRLSNAGTFDRGDQVGTWRVRDAATDEVVTESHSWPPPDTPAACIPRRVAGGLRPPPLPAVAFAGFVHRDGELHARFRLSNDRDEPACYVDFEGTPVVRLERLTPDGWEAPDDSWVCGGRVDDRVALPPGASIEVVRPLGRDDRPFRAVLTVPPPAFRQRAYERSARVDVPYARTAR